VKKIAFILISCVLLPLSAFSEDLAPDFVAASFKGKKITLAEVDKKIESIPVFALQKQRGAKDPKVINQLRRQAVDNMISRQLILDEAKKSGLVDEAKVDQDVKQIISSYGTEEKLSDLLKQIHTTLPDFKTNIADDSRMRMFLEKKFADMPKITDEELKQEFQKNPQRYSEQEQVRANHILVNKDTPDAEKKIQAIYAEVTKPKADFAAIASQKSDCPSKSRGGDLGLFRKGMMVPDFEKVAFELKPGEISKPVKTQFGWHIIKVEEHRQAGASSFEEAKPKIMQTLSGTRKSAAMQKYLEDLKKTAKVQVFLP
jgi:peptidyl-prolyl cis-trans isomerase C